jgi:hypothetical protein
MARVRGLRATLCCAALLTAVPAAQGGHEVPYYPSFYPQEIRIEPLDPAAAAKEFLSKTAPLNLYIGASPRFDGQAPGFVKSVTSLAGFVVATPSGQSREARCQSLTQASALPLPKGGDTVAHAYPVTPYHADYLGHVDRIPRPALAAGAAPAGDVAVVEVPVGEVLRMAGIGAGIWPAPSAAKEGWFQAYHLLRSAVDDRERGERADLLYERLLLGRFKDQAERLDLERELVAALNEGCERGVIAYRLRREMFSDDFSNGIENIAVDSQWGFNAPIVVRTAKLKDFPWNGWLRVGVGMEGEAKAAWNPVAGFTDAVGRLVWATVGDDAYLPVTYNSRWVQNRAEVVPDDEERKPSRSILVPADALMPQANGARLAPVGAGKGAMGKLVYRVSASAFQDGSEMEPADLLYPYALAFRWGEGGPGRPTFDPHIAAATRLLRDRLAGVRVLRVDERELAIADLTFRYRSPVVEVHLNGLSADEDENALIAPPWSSVPWHVLALMEAAVERDIAAFSEREAARRGIPWLDLVRDKGQLARMSALIAELARSGYRPLALEGLVSAEAATARWQALDKFVQANGHLLVTNGPYQLGSYTPQAYVFNVIRDFTYPVGIGTFDPFAYPVRAIVTRIEADQQRFLISADVEIAVKEQRNRRLTRQPLTHGLMRVIYPIQPTARYVVVGSDGKVAAAGSAKWEADGRFAAALPTGLSPGSYRLYAAIFADGNSTDPSIGSIAFEAK